MDKTRYPIWVIIIVLVIKAQVLIAGVDKPMPAFKEVFMSLYEQKALLDGISYNGSENVLPLFLAGAAEMNKEKEDAIREKLESFIDKMERKRRGVTSDKAFLKKVFYAGHRKHLKEYKPFHNLYSLFSTGSYNCLSGTAFYALVLEKLGYSYQVYETDYHIFLIVQTGEGEEILIESTDPLNGFVTGRQEIAERIEKIRMDSEGDLQQKSNDYYNFKLDVFRKVSLKQLAGLQYFNQAAHLYNKQQFSRAENALSKGRMLYPAERFERFSALLAGTN